MEKFDVNISEIHFMFLGLRRIQILNFDMKIRIGKPIIYFLGKDKNKFVSFDS